MSVGFGFSVGDFLATLRLVGTVIDALRETSHSTSTFENVVDELEALDAALKSVRQLEFEESQRFEKLALYQVAAQCQRSIDAFWTRIHKYQPHLSKGGTDSRLKDGWAKIRWAVCEQGEVDTFRAEIHGHTSSIQVLVAAIHAQAQQRQYKSLARSIQAISLLAMGKLRVIADGVAMNIQHGTTLVQTCAEILQTNLRVFQMVYDIQLFITRIPGQVQRQQPVYFVDAFNKECPFHLEFVRSAEALLAVLKVNFKNSGVGPKMIDRGDFVIEESGSNHIIDITREWETCFYPGQRVAMSMIWRKKEQTSSASTCPRCSRSHEGSRDNEIICSRCGIVYRRIEEVEDESQEAVITKHDQSKSLNHNEYESGPLRGASAVLDTVADEETSILQFRRLRILTSIMIVPPGWVWDSLSVSQASRFTLQRYLTRTFVKHEFPIKLLVSQKVHLTDMWYFCIPRLLTSNEKAELGGHSTTSIRRELEAITGDNEDGTLHPFWRPRGFWDDFEDSDSDSEEERLTPGGDTSDIVPPLFQYELTEPDQSSNPGIPRILHDAALRQANPKLELLHWNSSRTEKNENEVS